MELRNVNSIHQGGLRPLPAVTANAIAIALAAMACLCAVLALAPLARASGEFELNDDRNSAYGPLEGGVDYTAAFETDNDVDWFFFYVGYNSQMDFSAASPPDCIWYLAEIEVQDRDGKSIGEFESGANGKTEHLYLTLEAGTYYLKISRAAYGECTGEPYRFRIDPADAITTTPPPDEPATEPIPPGANPPAIIPKPTLLAGPKGRTSRHHASFRFWSNHPDGRLQCKLTGHRVPTRLKHWRRCTSPKHYTGLRLGKKVFWVRELDRGKSSKPVRRRWVVAKKPTSIVATPRAALLRVTCPLHRRRCKARVVIKAGKRTLASGRYSLPPRKTRTARLSLSKVGRRKLSRSGRTRAKAVFIDVRTGKQKAVPVVLNKHRQPR